MAKEVSGTGKGKLEWRINVYDGTWKSDEWGVLGKIWVGLKGFMGRVIFKVWRFLEKAWHIGVSDPRKVVHGVKVGLALSVVSLLYYMRPLYDDFGNNAMWAVMTVVVVFEYTVGATLSKCINRTTATLLAGALAVGIHWVAERSGSVLKPIILGVSVFVFASAATFSRFIPSVKAQFDYGATIFILTISLVSVSGYRVVELLRLAQLRLSTIAIGTSLCILITMLFCPIWAGCELHRLIHQNMEKLGDSLNGCVAEYLKENREENIDKELLGYKCVLNSRGTEESMSNFARWEPSHGQFNFGHPWRQYLKIGAALRNCAYCIDTLNGCITSEIQAPPCTLNHLSDKCLRVSSYSTNVLKELATTIYKMKKSSKMDVRVAEMNFAVQQLGDTLKSLPGDLITPSGQNKAIINVLPLLTLASFLVEIAARIGGVVDEVQALATLAEWDQDLPTN